MVMQRVLKLKVVVVIMAAALAGTFTVAAPANAAVGSWQKGISIQSRYNTDFASDSFKQSVTKAKGDGVNFIMLIVPIHQDNIYSSNVYAGGDTPTDSAIASGISYIKSQGMSVGIAIHDDPYDGQWRAYINAGDTGTWFSTYGALATKYASIAQANGASEMIIGTEMSTMTRSQNTSSWVSMIKNIRSVFSGALTYSAQHQGYMGDVAQVGFWQNLDYIGISAYYSLGHTSSQSVMESAWNDWNNREVSAVASQYGKKVIFTEIGFVSRDDAVDDPGSGYNLGTGTNTALQATAYSALFDYWNNSSVLAGVFLWDWSSDPNAGGLGDNGYTPQNKPAEAVMKQWYTSASTGSGSTGGGTTTPTQPTTPIQPTAPTTYTASLTGAATATVGNQAANTVSVSTNNALSDYIVDIEIYNAAGSRVAQTAYEHQTLGSTAKSYALNWAPSNADTYTVKVGVFTSGWAANPYWNNGLATITASAPVATTPTQPSNPSTPGMGGGSTAPIQPTQPTTPSQPTTPTQPTTPSQPSTPTQPSSPTTLPTDINIWWPGAGVTVGGVQPFKAVIDGRDLGTYDMYWQVDGGTLNQLSDVTNQPAHKESIVDLSGWHWNASHNYVINFVAKDKSGTVISQKSVTITVY